ncbi:glycosyltransferase family 2 protein [Nocardioides sp. B-3]|uniref:glycosyltransferase family 2 protein n=1 Tax=Nocardioides sp. B-3 TaxID=2895565 RepID=UPI0021539D74|nr:hypothetical protein [Nocardioides sp. B-3]UUZ60421.1 hypothetical protein LP418_05855 [Nocardioides sp. B-3]
MLSSRTTSPARWLGQRAPPSSWTGPSRDRVGPWDESFLLYSEETEFMLRAADHGWATWYEPAAVVEHKGGESGVRPSPAALLTVNRVVLFKRRHGSVGSVAYTSGVLLGTLLRSAAGRRTARASLVALLFPSRRIASLAELR